PGKQLASAFHSAGDAATMQMCGVSTCQIQSVPDVASKYTSCTVSTCGGVMSCVLSAYSTTSHTPLSSLRHSLVQRRKHFIRCHTLAAICPGNVSLAVGYPPSTFLLGFEYKLVDSCRFRRVRSFDIFMFNSMKRTRTGCSYCGEEGDYKQYKDKVR
ncbi:hypothetical protein J6590_003039, partial [Homalodisca vitripennis]